MFLRHANRYFEMYLPNIGCEIAETQVPTSERHVKRWQAGDEIRFCTGVLVPITSDEERALENGRLERLHVFTPWTS